MMKTKFLILVTLLPKTTSYQRSPSHKFLGLKTKTTNLVPTLVPLSSISISKSYGPHPQNASNLTAVACPTTTTLLLATVPCPGSPSGPLTRLSASSRAPTEAEGSFYGAVDCIRWCHSPALHFPVASQQLPSTRGIKSSPAPLSNLTSNIL